MHHIQIAGNGVMDSLDAFDPPTETEIIGLWQTFRASGLSARQAWDAIVAGIALDVAFSDGRKRPRREQ